MIISRPNIDSAISGRYTVSAPYKAGAGVAARNCQRRYMTRQRLFIVRAHARQNYGGLGRGRKARRSPLTPVLRTLFSLPPVSFAAPVVEVFHSQRRLPSWLRSQPSLNLKLPSLMVRLLLHPGCCQLLLKRHDDVLKKIRTLECSASFTARNFSVSDYTDCTGRKLPCYQITRDGFAFLAMGFTGKRAARFKEAYINAFNLMEKSLSGADASDMSAVARNARGVYLHLREIHQIWTSQLYPMLKAVESPLASKLYDRVGDAVFGAALVDSRLNGSDKEVRP